MYTSKTSQSVNTHVPGRHTIDIGHQDGDDAERISLAYLGQVTATSHIGQRSVLAL